MRFDDELGEAIQKKKSTLDNITGKELLYNAFQIIFFLANNLLVGASTSLIHGAAENYAQFQPSQQLVQKQLKFDIESKGNGHS